MEFIDPHSGKDSGECAEFFCKMTLRMLTYAIGKVSNGACVQALDEIRGIYRKALGTAYTHEQMTEKIGAFLWKFNDPISRYDDNFFKTFDFMSMFASGAPVEKYVGMRSSFYDGTTAAARGVVFDALNIMLILYAHYLDKARRT